VPVLLPADRDRDAWQVAIWNAPDDELSRPQKLELMGMIETAYNAFDPFRVVADLLAHRGLWVGAVMSRGFPFQQPAVPRGWYLHANLIDLRDIDRCRNLDTVYLLLDDRHADALRAVAANWRADEVNLYTGDIAAELLGIGGACGRSVLRVWWD
jgi:hypothetical protein